MASSRRSTYPGHLAERLTTPGLPAWRSLLVPGIHPTHRSSLSLLSPGRPTKTCASPQVYDPCDAVERLSIEIAAVLRTLDLHAARNPTRAQALGRLLRRAISRTAHNGIAAGRGCGTLTPSRRIQDPTNRGACISRSRPQSSLASTSFVTGRLKAPCLLIASAYRPWWGSTTYWPRRIHCGGTAFVVMRTLLDN